MQFPTNLCLQRVSSCAEMYSFSSKVSLRHSEELVGAGMVSLGFYIKGHGMPSIRAMVDEFGIVWLDAIFRALWCLAEYFR